METPAWVLLKIPFFSEAEASPNTWAAESQRLFRVLVPSSILQRAEQKVTRGLSVPCLWV